MSTFSFGASVASALALFLAASLQAASPAWNDAPFSASPAALLADAKAVQPKSKDGGVVVLLDEAHFVLDGMGRTTRTDRLLYRVDDEASVEDWSNVEAPWSPWYQERPHVEARVVTSDGSAHLLDPKSFSTADGDADSDMFDDTRTVRGPLPAIAVGSVVEELIAYKEKNPIYDAGTVQRWIFGRGVECEQSRLVIEYPVALPVHIVNHTNPHVEPIRTEAAGVVRLVYETRNLQPDESAEWSLPSDTANFSYVAFSTGCSWQEVARRYAEIVDRQIAAAPVALPLSATLTGEKDPRAIAAKILDSVERGIRYAGVEFGEGSIIPRAPAETVSHKYGDCKDKAILLVALLRQAGVPAHVVLLDAGQGHDVERDLPGLGQFNHAIAVIDGPERVWIDPTDEFARAGELPAQDQDRLALIVDPGTTALISTPVDSAERNRVVETRTFKLLEDGKSSVVETSEYYGNEERRNRRFYAGSEVKQQREQLEKYVSSVYLTDSLSHYGTSDPHDLSKPFTLTIEAAKAGRGLTTQSEAAVGLFLSRMVQDMPWGFRDAAQDSAEPKPGEKPRKPRVHDYVFASPYTLEMHYRIELPPGYALRAEPPSGTTKLGSATLTKEVKVLPDGIVALNYRFDSGPRRISALQFEETRKAISASADDGKALIVYFDQQGRKLLAEGDVRGAIAEARRLEALHPAEWIHHGDEARALLAGGMGSAARREAKKGVEIEPKSAHAHQTLGWILTHDLIGRQFGMGFDRAGAIAEYRKARELDPKDVVTRSELAMVLTRDNDGVPYASPVQMGEAVDEYLAMKKDVKADNEAIDRELMVLYTRSGRFDELRKLANATKDEDKKYAFRLIATALLDGASKAVTESETIPLEKRRDSQSLAASVLAVIRDYPQAAALLDAAALGAPTASALRGQADLMRKARRYEELLSGPETPRLLFTRMMAAGNEKDINKAIRPFLSTDALDTIEESKGPAGSKSQTSAMIQSGGRARLKMRREGTGKFFIDVAMASAQLQQDGSDEIGYRIRARMSGAGLSSDLGVFVVREGNGYKIAAVSQSGEMLGLRAFRLVGEGKLDAARQWLDWAREATHHDSDDDALSADPFSALWTRGQSATREQLLLAAATLMNETKAVATLAIPALLAGRDGATDEEKPRIDLALASSYQTAERWSELLPVAERLCQRYPSSGRAFRFRMMALSRLGRGEEADTVALARLAKYAGDRIALKALAERRIEEGRPDESYEYFGKVLDGSDPKDEDYNAHAWSALFAKADLTKATEEARQAVTLSPDSYSALNTLAAVYAERGSSAEARDTLLRSLDASGREELAGPDWYIAGRLAENYGVNEAALDAYAKVTKMEQERESSWDLAQKRIAGLKK